MRISDWSSDVCSSDLEADGRAIGQLDGFDPVGRGVAPDRHVRSQSRPQHHNQRKRRGDARADRPPGAWRSEEHTSELQSLMRISYAVFCLKKKKKKKKHKKERNRERIRANNTSKQTNA